MNQYAHVFANYAKEHFDFENQPIFNYQSLSCCLLDCVYSLRAKYYSVTLPTVDRYAEKYMGGDRDAKGDTLSNLIGRIEENGYLHFAMDILNNRQQLSGRFKSEVVLDLAKKLRLLNINTIEDFKSFGSVEFLECAIRCVRGIGDAGVNYLFMLAGDQNRCKPDVHIHNCIKDACGTDVSNAECQELMSDTVNILKKEYPHITVRSLDGCIWKAYQVGSKK